MQLKGMEEYMVEDILYNKIEIIERCLIRVKEVYDQNPANLNDYTKQDSIEDFNEFIYEINKLK